MLKKLNYLLLFIIFIIFVIFCYQKFVWQYFVGNHQLVTVTLKDNFFVKPSQTLKIEVVKTPNSLARGLSGRSALIDQKGEKIDGLLFIFPTAEIQNFWMKEMQFNIDICWLNQWQVFNCTRNVPYPSEGQSLRDLDVYSSPSPASAVLETLPGFLSDEYLGQKIFLSFR